ncbi:hypothetical protein P3S68_012284 [Capsicum galapagoense]
MSLIRELLSIMKEKQMVEEKDFPYVQKILTACEKGIEEEKRSIHEKYSKIIEEDYKEYKRTNDLLFDRIEMRKKAKSDKEARYEKKIIEFRGRISRLKETKRKNDEDLEMETARQAPGATGVNLKRNNVESSHGGDRAIGLFADPKRVGTSTGNSSGQSRHKGMICRLDVMFAYILLLSGLACGIILDKPKTMSVRVISDNDDDMTLNEIARASTRRGQKKEVRVKGSSNSMQKRKRSMNEGKNNVASE